MESGLRAIHRGANSPTPVEAGSRTARGLTHPVFNVRVSGKSNGFRLDEDDRQEKTKFRGCDRVGWVFTLAAAALQSGAAPKLLMDAAQASPRTASSSDGGGSSRPTSHEGYFHSLVEAEVYSQQME
jgi:hypothetical protein